MKYNQRQVIILRCKIYLSQDIPRGELHESLEAKKRIIKLKTDTQPYIHVCIIPFNRTSAFIILNIQYTNQNSCWVL